MRFERTTDGHIVHNPQSFDSWPPGLDTPTELSSVTVQKRTRIVIPSLLPDSDQGQYCPGCRKYRSLSHFPNGRKTCDHCKQLRDKSHAKYLGIRRISDVARRYSLTGEELQQMRDDRQGKCAICGETETKFKKNGEVYALAVDHNHQTGQVRSLLCQRCNLLIGHLEKVNQDLVDRAWAYLSKHR